MEAPVVIMAAVVEPEVLIYYLGSGQQQIEHISLGSCGGRLDKLVICLCLLSSVAHYLGVNFL